MLGHIWFYFVHLFLNTLFTLGCGLKIEGKENLKFKGGCLFAANHTSYMDPPLFGAISARRVNCMAKKELFTVPILAPLIRSLGAIPVDRDKTEMTTIKKAVELLKKGEIVGIFPEGRRMKSEEDEGKESRRGVSLLAKMSGVPVLPISIINGKDSITIKKGIPHFKRGVKVVIGKPIQYVKASNAKEEKENMENFAHNLISEIMKPVEEARKQIEDKKIEEK